ncbi:MAG: hypothetical protein MR902_07020, partial [Campylobacter sp.]|nr:hypothetical protein [Campylobacter sp.]
FSIKSILIPLCVAVLITLELSEIGAWIIICLIDEILKECVILPFYLMIKLPLLMPKKQNGVVIFKSDAAANFCK